MPDLPNCIEGTVDSVVYQNPENGYTVLRLDVEEEELGTVVGCMPGVECTGHVFGTHEVHGVCLSPKN